MAKVTPRGNKETVIESVAEATVEAIEDAAGVETSNNSNTSKVTKMVNSSNKVFISIDNTFEDVIQYQSDGRDIFFLDDEETFLQLSNDEVQQLDLFTREKYRIARAVATQSLDLDSIKTAHMKYKPRENFASATNRLLVRGGDPNKHYSWKRPDELQQVVYEGGKICIDPKVETFGGVDSLGRTLGGGTSHKVSANGETELVLCETTAESNDARIQDIEARSRRQNAAVETTAIAALDAMGGNASGVSNRP